MDVRINNDWQKMDYVTLTYNGNQLIHATDTVNGPNYPASLSNVPHFHDKTITGNEYVYDSNGNMTEDLNKGITNITYNLLDLPYLISINGNTIEYDYDAMGTKLRGKDITSSGTTRTDYCGNVIYENGTPTRLLTDSGYITLSDSKYHFYYKDHEGNNRVVVDQSNTVEQVNNYYPFGLSYNNDASTSANKYKYNGKELQTQHGLDWYDYGARFYDPELCQWHTLDTLCERYYNISPYAYCEDNPIRKIDTEGKKIVDLNGNIIYSDQNGWVFYAPSELINIVNRLIDLYEESADVYSFYHNYQTEDVMAATLGHEFVHTIDKDNWMLDKSDIEVKPTKVEFDILKKLNDLNIYLYLKINWKNITEPYNYSTIK
jgi:RHS repeat-associated protein